LADRAGAGPWPRLARLGIDARVGAAGLARVAVMVAVVALAEGIFLAGGLIPGAIAELTALGVLLSLAAVYRGRPDGAAAIALSLLPLLRVLSIALPSVLVPTWLWHAEIGIPVIAGTVLAARLCGIAWSELGLRRPPVIETAIAGAAGLLLGLVAARIANTSSLLPDRSILTAVLASAAVVVGAALAEELLFRGLLMRVAEDVVVGSGIVVATALSTLLYVATLNPRYIIFSGAVSLLFAILTRRSKSIGPALACHALLVWSQLILWPAILG